MNDVSLYSEDKHKYGSAFTIVELLIVIVVIAILAAIALVSYNGITAQAEDSALKSALRTASNKVSIEQVKDGVYPDSLPNEIEADTNTHTLAYTGGESYCITAFSKKNSDRAFHVSSQDGSVKSGKCDIHNAPIPITAEACFNFDSSVGIISDYYDHEGNDPGNPACPRDVNIPSEIDGVMVARIGDMAFGDNQLTSVIIPDSVVSMGNSVFYNNQLTSITIPDSIAVISSGTFYDNQLTSVTIPNSVFLIGSSAFRDNQLTSVTIPNSVTSIGSSAFQTNQLGNVSLPSHLSSHQGDPSIAFGVNPSLTFTIRP